MFEDLTTIIKLIEQNIQKKYDSDINVKFLYLSFKKDIVGWINPIISLSDKGYKYVYEYEKSDLRHNNTKYTIKQQIPFPGKVYMYNIIDEKLEYIRLYKTCLQTLFITNNDRQYNTFHIEFSRLNNLRLCDNLILRIRDIPKIINHILHKRSDLFPIMLNIGDEFKKAYIKENVNFKRVFLNTVIQKNEINLDIATIQENLQFRLIYEIVIDINNNIYNKLLNVINKTSTIYYSDNNELHIHYNIPKYKVNIVLHNLLVDDLIKELELQFKDISYNVSLNVNTVTDKKFITLQLDLPVSRTIFTDILVYLSMPNLKYI